MRTFYSNGKKTKDILERAKNKPAIVTKPDNFNEEAVQLIYDELNSLKTKVAELVITVEELTEEVETFKNVGTKVAELVEEELQEQQEKTTDAEKQQEDAPKTQTDSEKLSKKVK